MPPDVPVLCPELRAHKYLNFSHCRRVCTRFRIGGSLGVKGGGKPAGIRGPEMTRLGGRGEGKAVGACWH